MGARDSRSWAPPLHTSLQDLYEIYFATRAPRYTNKLSEQLSEVRLLEERPNTDPVNSEKSISRMTLRQVLFTGLEDVVHFGTTFKRYEQDPDGTGLFATNGC